MNDFIPYEVNNLQTAPYEAEGGDSESDVENDEFYEALTISQPEIGTQDPVEVLFQRHVEEAISLCPTGPRDDTERTTCMTFVVNRLRESWQNTTTSTGQNFLHYLAYYKYDRKRINLFWLMHRAIHKGTYLLGLADETKRTPLAVALSVGNDIFIRATIQLKSDKIYQVTQVLRKECVSHGSDHDAITCLHAAVTSLLRKDKTWLDLFSKICDLVPEEMFTATNQQGRTPLHLAVEYDRCCDAQVKIVHALLRRGMKALNVTIPASNSEPPRSVYQHHQKMFRLHEAGKKGKSMANTLRHLGHDVNGQRNAKELSVASTLTEPRKDLLRDEKGNMGPPPKFADIPNRTEPGLQRTSSMKTAAIQGDNDSQKANDRKARSSASTAQSSALARSTTQQILDTNNEKQRAARKIGEYLKLLYLRSETPENAARYLLMNDDKEIWFDFGFKSKSLTEREFELRFEHLELDNILQYVAFPKVLLQDNKGRLRSLRRGSQDMVFCFKWLKSKGVERIIQITVDDLEPISHSDEAIEEALKPFDVEILDWRRLDLDPVTLTRVGKCLREVHLQWSGTNAVLRAWSDQEGLAKIPTLERIHIIQVEGLNSDQRTRDNVEEFEKRIHSTWPSDREKPKVDFRLDLRTSDSGDDPQSGNAKLSLGQDHSLSSHKWLKCMRQFASSFRQINALRNKPNDKSLNPVRVALIDDGTDIFHENLGGVRFSGKSFQTIQEQEHSKPRVEPYWDSRAGHGTLMARLINLVCPSAVIHVIKLRTFYAGGSPQLQFCPESAVEAIEHATDEGVHIICMSWTMKPPEDADLKRRFDDAIHRCLNTSKILMFCAASDQGMSTDLTYPHASNRDSFRIGAAKASGKVLGNVGDAQKLSYIFPGHGINLDDGYGDGYHKLEGHSGSSIANALAVGLAALIIECVRLGVIYSSEREQPDENVAITRADLARIRDREHMDAALASIGTSRDTDYKHIEVWKVFNNAAEKLRGDNDATSQLEVIAGLARVFLRKGVIV